MNRLFASVALTLLLAGCGGTTAARQDLSMPSANGTWAEVSATPASGPVPPGFSFTMMTGGASMMSFSNLQMLNLTPCFGEGSVMSSTGMMSGGMMGGGMMGPGNQITMDLWSDATHTGNHLQMVMVMNDRMDGMTGTYTLTGVTPGCSSGSGTITMGRK